MRSGRVAFHVSGATRVRRRMAGQGLAEFAIVVPVLIALIGGVIQFGLIFWSQNTLTQVVRDTGRWAATQTACWIPGDLTPIPPGSTTAVDIATQANAVAQDSSLLGYSASSPWTATDESTSTLSSQGDANVAAFTSEGVAIAWVAVTDPGNNPTQDCPPPDNAYVYHVTIKINHTIPIFMPGLQYLPGIGTCDASGCHLVLSSTAQYRLEPSPLASLPTQGGVASRVE